MSILFCLSQLSAAPKSYEQLDLSVCLQSEYTQQQQAVCNTILEDIDAYFVAIDSSVDLQNISEISNLAMLSASNQSINAAAAVLPLAALPALRYVGGRVFAAASFVAALATVAAYRWITPTVHELFSNVGAKNSTLLTQVNTKGESVVSHKSLHSTVSGRKFQRSEGKNLEPKMFPGFVAALKEKKEEQNDIRKTVDKQQDLLDASVVDYFGTERVKWDVLALDLKTEILKLLDRKGCVDLRCVSEDEVKQTFTLELFLSSLSEVSEDFKQSLSISDTGKKAMYLTMQRQLLSQKKGRHSAYMFSVYYELANAMKLLQERLESTKENSITVAEWLYPLTLIESYREANFSSHSTDDSLNSAIKDWFGNYFQETAHYQYIREVGVIFRDGKIFDDFLDIANDDHLTESLREKFSQEVLDRQDDMDIKLSLEDKKNERVVFQKYLNSLEEFLIAITDERRSISYYNPEAADALWEQSIEYATKPLRQK